MGNGITNYSVSNNSMQSLNHKMY